MELDNRQIKGSNIRMWVIIGLVIIIIILLFSNTLSEDTKRNFYYFLGVVIVVGAVVYVLFKKKRMDVFKIGRYILDKEYIYTGKRINLSDINVDTLDADVLVIGFESAGDLITYKWDRKLDTIISRLNKKIDAVKSESNERELTRELSRANIERSKTRRIAERDGYELIDKEDT